MPAALLHRGRASDEKVKHASCVWRAQHPCVLALLTRAVVPCSGGGAFICRIRDQYCFVTVLASSIVVASIFCLALAAYFLARSFNPDALLNPCVLSHYLLDH